MEAIIIIVVIVDVVVVAVDEVLAADVEVGIESTS